MRKLGLLTTLWTALLFFPLSSFALGLGEIEVDSFLNQPLKAEIEVVSARPGEVDDLLVSLASRDAFRKAGLQRPSHLSKLRFKVEKSEDGQSARILISTKTPVKEPFLNFLVEADWAKGRLLREFTILLDPPYFSQQAETAVTPPPAAAPPAAEQAVDSPMSSRMEETLPETAESQQFAAEPVSQPIALSGEPETSQESIPFVEDNTYLQGDTGSGDIVVEKGDTLWGIASQFKDPDHSMAQVMLAMQALNPDAFARDNINNLKVGAVLRVPDMNELDRLSKQEAYAQVLEQNGLWDEYIARKTGATTTGSPVAAAVEQAPAQEAEAQLSLLAPGDGDSTSASLQNDENSVDAGQIRKQLALAEEELEASRLENDDLKSRIADLEQQLAKVDELQKLVQIEDTSLAQLQGGATEETETPAFTPPLTETESTADATQQEMTGFVEDQPAEEQPTDVMIEAADEMMAEKSDDQLNAEAEGDQLDESVAMTGPEQLSSEAETIIQTVEQPDAMASDEEQQATGEQEGTFVPAPVIVTEPPMSTAEGGILDMLPSLDSLIADPVMLGGIGAILALLLGFMFLKRKKTEKEEDSSDGMLLDEDDLLDDDATPIHVPTVDDADNPETDIDKPEDFGILETEQIMADTLAVEAEEIADAPSDEFTATEIVNAEDMPVAEEPAAAEEQDDVLNEVDVYLAYGLYDNAEDLLKESLQESPDRADYRAKLLDTYFATKNAGGFIQEAEALKSLGGAADRYWDRVQIMGFELAPDNELFAAAADSDLSVSDLEYAKPDTPDFDIGAEDDITDFSNTDFDLGVDSDDFNVTSELLDSELDQQITDTQTVAPSGSNDDLELPDLETEDRTRVREEEISQTDNLELPDEIGDFALDLDESDIEANDDIDDDALNFDLPDDLNLDEQTSESIIPLEPTVKTEKMDEIPPMDEDNLDLDIEGSHDLDVDFEENEEVSSPDGEVSQTMVMAPGEAGGDSESEIEFDAEEGIKDDDVEGTQHLEAALDMDMSDLENADLHTGNFKVAGENGEAEITEFSPAEITGEFSSFEPEEDSALEEVDTSAGLDKTGTYAPGDFNDEEADESSSPSSESDDIEDLMLPDDVDEVGTKLDLAKAFIDMGDAEGAKSSLEEVLSEGTEEQKAEAKDLLAKI